MRRLSSLAVIPVALLLQGCLAKAALDVATLPVRAVSKGVDLATTSQSESDEKRGREIRRREERLANLEREYGKQKKACEAGDSEECAEARITYTQIQAILPTIPVEPEN